MSLAHAEEAARVRALRPLRPPVDPWRPLGVQVEQERNHDGRVDTVATVFLAGAECPFTCVFCDLWRHTLAPPTPAGALPTQLRLALADEAVRAANPRRIKLYNASNFFEPRAVPPADLPALARLVAAFAGVTVESHPRLVSAACFEFARSVGGRLEVAMGLETIHPRAWPRLGKQASPDDFAAAAARLREAGLGVRAFVLVGAPFVPAQESVEWAVRSAEWALDRGAEVVALIPVRGGNGELERLAALGEFVPPGVRDLEAVLEGALGLPHGVVIADLWEAQRLHGCPACRTERMERLARLNLTGRVESAVRCDACAGAVALR
jgi:radical SAM enzyme (TIGR01210 family)